MPINGSYWPTSSLNMPSRTVLRFPNRNALKSSRVGFQGVVPCRRSVNRASSAEEIASVPLQYAIACSATMADAEC